MKDEKLEMLRLRFVQGQTLQEIGNTFGMTREGVRHSLKTTVQKMSEALNMAELTKNDIIESEDDEIIKLAYMMGSHFRDKFKKLIIYHRISSLKDFVLLSKTQIKNQTCFGRLLRLNLYKLGVAYDPADDFESLERGLMNIYSKRPKSDRSNGKQLRFKILDRDNFTCRYCGKNPKNAVGTILEVDHIVPLSKGGTWDDSNLITACRDCNAGKSDSIITIE
jgi:predicted DNA-binding protein (UPF0251 family)/rubredoxin